jgi:hypothetical protein
MSCIIFVAFAILLGGCKQEPENLNYKQDLAKPAYFHNSINKLTDVIVHDIFSPPVASRVYVYPCIAAYEVLAQSGQVPSLGGKLNGLTASPPADTTGGISYELASLEAFLLLSQQLIFSEDKILAYKTELYQEIDSIGIPAKAKDNSLKYGKVMADHIAAWADKDNYKESRSFSKFSVTDKENEWKPTPPGYMEGIEPHWREIRTMVLDSATQFVPEPPTVFDLEKSSKFYKEVMEVYEAVKTADKEKKTIASFWDCNPYVMNQTGHVMFATKKITPGGHWMGITSIASDKANSSFAESVRHSTIVAITLFDGFISCWDEKYRSNLIRPETVINEHIDRDWTPLLQTPPFPEHTSGHSVISTASAEVLTAMLGDNFSFTDDVEVQYGLPMRKFNSFREAAAEAAISRLYGGIHYMPAIDEGVKQGREVGGYVVEKIIEI